MTPHLKAENKDFVFLFRDQCYRTWLTDPSEGIDWSQPVSSHLLAVPPPAHARQRRAATRQGHVTAMWDSLTQTTGSSSNSVLHLFNIQCLSGEMVCVVFIETGCVAAGSARVWQHTSAAVCPHTEKICMIADVGWEQYYKYPSFYYRRKTPQWTHKKTVHSHVDANTSKLKELKVSKRAEQTVHQTARELWGWIYLVKTQSKSSWNCW